MYFAKNAQNMTGFWLVSGKFKLVKIVTILTGCKHIEMISADTPRQRGASPNHSNGTFTSLKSPVSAKYSAYYRVL